MVRGRLGKRTASSRRGATGEAELYSPTGAVTRSAVTRRERGRREPAAPVRQEPGAGSQGDWAPSKFHGCFSSKAVQEVISAFGADKLALLESVGLGGLRFLQPLTFHSRTLVFSLLRRVDLERMRLCLFDGSYLEMTEESVNRILGIRCSGLDVMVRGDRKLPMNVKSRIQRVFNTWDLSDLPTMEDAKRILVRDYGGEMTSEEKDNFVVALAAFICGYMLWPSERSAVVPKNILEFISNADNVQRCNWSRYVLCGIESSARKLQKNIRKSPFSVILSGCWLYLELLYIDSIDFGKKNIPWSWTPRLRYYGKQKITELMDMDRSPDGTYGVRLRRIRTTRDCVAEPQANAVPAAEPSSYTTSRQPRDSSNPGCSYNSVSASVQDVLNSIHQDYARMAEQVNGLAAAAQEENRINYERQTLKIDKMFSDLRAVLDEQKHRMINYVTNTACGKQVEQELTLPDGGVGARAHTGSQQDGSSTGVQATVFGDSAAYEDEAASDDIVSEGGVSLASADDIQFDETAADGLDGALQGAEIDEIHDGGTVSPSVPENAQMDEVAGSSGVEHGEFEEIDGGGGVGTLKAREAQMDEAGDGELHGGVDNTSTPGHSRVCEGAGTSGIEHADDSVSAEFYLEHLRKDEKAFVHSVPSGDHVLPSSENSNGHDLVCMTDEHGRVLYIEPSDFEACENNQGTPLLLSCSGSSMFDEKLNAVLSQPYDKDEYEDLWRKATERNPVSRQRHLRSASKVYVSEKVGRSYLDYYSDLAIQIESAGHDEKLSLLRKFFFWLQNLCHEGAYKPWMPKTSACDPILVDEYEPVQALEVRRNKARG